MQTLLRREEFEDTYQSRMNKIWEAFDVYLKKGSGWILERVKKILLNTYDYKPIHISSYIPTPKAIIWKKALINTRNKLNKKCFEYSVNSALHHDEIDKRQGERESQYTTFVGQLKGRKEPMPMDDIPICVYRVEHEINIISQTQKQKLWKIGELTTFSFPLW